ncbi:ATP-binding protein [Caulobacter sp. NIBR1757]|uniref:AlbA family DNA-binding domain-containing protein n=1 Tax=Caulobacter sp. NIBR1757 TaxID=3016000 RepID=UPI0022F129AC|nr:ATP-binding protein [Caulobacter sp. NIBR1757]WGM41269.1 hypothetical protein AMEJIAPC_04220 [Caulobacter sp. NIBR1757]
MKRMKLRGLARDHIMSFFIRPGRIISSAAPSEVMTKRPDIEAATPEEVEAFINRRLNEASTSAPYHGFGPTSSVRVREILQIARDGQQALPGFEGVFAEFKSQPPKDQVSKAKIAKSMAAFANHRGGYIFIGVADDGEILGLPDDCRLEKMWNEIADVTTQKFTPFFRWERGIFETQGKTIAVAYVFECEQKPVISSTEYTREIPPGTIYFRYNRSSEAIKPGDLLEMLRARDQKVRALSFAEPTPATTIEA